MIKLVEKNLGILDVIKYLSRFERNVNIAIVLVLLIISSLSEFLTLLAISGFISILSLEKENFSNIKFLKFLFDSIGLSNPSLSQVSLILASTILISAFLKIVSYKKNLYLASSIGSNASKAYLSSFLNQKFDSFLNRSESEIVNVTTNYANSVVVFLYNILFLVSSVVSSLAVLIGIVLLDRNIALFLIFILPITYYIITFRIRKQITFNGKLIALETEKHVSLVKNVFGSFRDVILSGSINNYVDDYFNIDKHIRFSRANSLNLSAFPRFILEPFFILLLTTYIIFNANEGRSDSLYLIFGSSTP